VNTNRRSLLAAVAGLEVGIGIEIALSWTKRRKTDVKRGVSRTWHVDNRAARNGDGRTWETAWSALSNIRWSSIRPGDTIFISGGGSGQIYNETLIVGRSGSTGVPITIAAGTAARHDGPVTIDAQGVRSRCIVIENHNHVIVRNLIVQNTADDANLTVKGATAGVLVENIISHSGAGPGGGGNCRCFDIRDCIASAESVAVTLQHCFATTPASTPSQTDALWTSGNNGLLVCHNVFVVTNTDPTGHSDCIQSYADFGVTFRGNLLIHPNGGVNNHGFIVSDVQSEGVLYFYNNIIVMGSTPGRAANRAESAIFRQYTIFGHTGIVKIWNNTIYGGYAAYYAGSTVGALPPGDEFKNNILYMLPNSVAPYFFQAGAMAVPGNIDFNLVYNFRNNLAVFNNGNVVGAARSTSSKSSGSAYFEVQIGEGVRSGNTMVGIGSVRAPLTYYTGATQESVGWEWREGAIYYDGGIRNEEFVKASPSDVVAFAVNFDKKKFWIKNLTQPGGWNGGAPVSHNPETGVGGYPIPPTLHAPYYIMISVGSGGDSLILNVGATPFIGAVPAGFSAWDAATVLNETDVASPATLTAPVGFIEDAGFHDWPAWRMLGYDQHGLNCDPLFVDAASRNFRLRSTSPALRAGVSLPDVGTDYAGTPRPHNAAYDLGAYQT